MVNPALGTALAVGKGVIEYKAAKSRAKAQKEAVERVNQLAAEAAKQRAPPAPSAPKVSADTLARLEANDKAIAAQLVALQSREHALSTPPERYARYTGDKRPGAGADRWFVPAALLTAALVLSRRG